MSSESRVARVEFDVNVPDGVDPKAIGDWLRYNLGIVGHLNGDNPLVDKELEARPFSMRFKVARRTNG